MSFATKFNKGHKFTFRTSGDVTYKKLSEIYENDEKTYKVYALYQHISKFGLNSVVAISENVLVDLPKHLNENITEILNDNEAIEAINNGLVGFTIYRYTNKKYNKTGYSIRWVDIG